MDSPHPDMRRLKDMLQSPALRVIAYFLALASVFGGLALTVPWFAGMLVPAPPGSEAFPGLSDSVGPSASELTRTVGETAVLGLLSLLGALSFTIPVVWIYTVIMRQEGYDRSFVRMLASLAVVVAGVVQVVRGDLALAFALAGIVAAVRFRTTVKDLQDAVFAFAAIGIGLAAGTGSFTLAGAISTVFTLLAYVLWRLNVGDIGPSLELSHGGVALAEALAPGESKAVVVGDKSQVEPVHADDLPTLSAYIDRLADYIRGDALRKKKKYNTLLLVHTEKPDEAEALVEPILDEHACRWVEVDRIERNGGSGLVAVEYLLRLKKKVKVGRMIDKLDCGEENVCRAAELKPIRGLRKRLT